MIRATAKAPGGTLAFLGLGPENLARLTAGQPIRVNLADYAGDGSGLDVRPVDQVVVFYDPDGSALAQLLEAVTGVEVHQ